MFSASAETLPECIESLLIGVLPREEWGVAMLSSKSVKRSTTHVSGTPKQVLCLQRSAVTTCLMRHNGLRATMVLGAQTLPFKAHAWTEVDGRAVNERRDVQSAKFRGDWAISTWHPKDRHLILARDYLGVKPLFYYLQPKRLTWCSHLAALALCGEQFTVCDEYIAGYLAFYPDAHLTPYHEIQSVPPGAFVSVRGGQLKTCRYWTLDTQLRNHHKTDAGYEEEYRFLFRQAVRRRLRTDSPTLSELSGGFDSSSIVCIADDILAKEGAETPRLDTP